MSLTNHIQSCIARFQSNIGYCRLGIVTEVNPLNSTIQAVLEPQETATNDIPYATPWIGWYAPPVPGDQVLVLFQEGSKNVPIGALLLYWNNATPPAGVSSGEAILQHSSGAYIKLKNDGSIIINSDKVQLGENNAALKKLVTEAMVEFFNTHTHGGGSPPDQQMNDTQLTTNTTAN